MCQQFSNNLSERKALNWQDHAKVTNKTRYSMWNTGKKDVFLKYFEHSLGIKKIPSMLNGHLPHYFFDDVRNYFVWNYYLLTWYSVIKLICPTFNSVL